MIWISEPSQTFLSSFVDMKIFGHVTFLLLFGGIFCQNNRNAKAGKSTKKPGGNQGVDVGQSSSEVDLAPISTGSTAGTSNNRGTGNKGGTSNNRGAGTVGANGGSGNSRGTSSPAPGQQTEDMRLHFLKNTHVTCNDGTAAG